MLPPHLANGVRFTCIDCGECCTGSPGVVALSEKEAQELATYCSLTLDQLIEQYLEPYANGYRIRETDEGACVFFDQRCTIYEARPTQCRTYPFWFKNLRSEKAWQATCAACPGIGAGKFYDEVAITQHVAIDLESRSVPTCRRKA